MDFPCTLLATLLLLLLAIQMQSAEHCSSPSSISEYKNAVIEAACAFDSEDVTGQSFRNETRFNHGGGHKADTSNSYAPVFLFSLYPSAALCESSCANIDRENVKWCVRIADPDRNIETCISLNGTEEVFESTCDAEPLNLEPYLSLPDFDECSRLNHQPTGGCLALTNVGWIFGEAYLTCYSTNGTCSDISFTRTQTLAFTNKPEITDYTTSPHQVQPSDQIIMTAVATTTTASSHATWHHGNTTYDKPIAEDPLCTGLNCTTDNHPNVPELKKQRIRLFFSLTTLGEQCLGSDIFSVKTYLIIDNATSADAGNYTVNITFGATKPDIVEQIINVVVECEPISTVQARCNTSKAIVMQHGASTMWTCDLRAPPASMLSVMHNKTVIQHSEPTGKDSLETLCDKEPRVFYQVEEDQEHKCYSSFVVRVVVCAAKEGVQGEYSIFWGGQNITEGSAVSVKLEPPSTGGLGGGTKGVSHAAYIAPVGILILVLLTVIVITVVVIRTRKRKRTRAHISQLNSPAPTTQEAAFYKKNGEFSPMSLLSPQSISAAYNDPLEFPRNRLYVYTKKVLGEGSFGRVLQAKAEGIVPGMPDRNVVAIKTTKENATREEIEELLSELDLMKKMEPHENILNLLGQCTTPGGPVCLIVEFARYGNLRDFLRQCEEVVLSLNHKPHIPRNRSRTRTFSSTSYGSTQPLMTRQDSSVFTPGSGNLHHFVFPLPSPPAQSKRTTSCSSDSASAHAAHHPNTAVPLAHSVAPIGHDYINTKGLVYMEDVHNFALQIACGLQHLASMQIVHCDLAARNVLIAEGFVLKIADFGLARDISGKEMYKKNPRGKIPVKWTAPEALENRVFTTKSDVWSYGVVLWELFTYGHTPYPDVHLGQSYEAIISYLKEGNRMTQPDSCADSFYELMQKCWTLDPDERPTPIDIVGALTPLDGSLQGGNTDGKTLAEENSEPSPVKANGNHHFNDE